MNKNPCSFAAKLIKEAVMKHPQVILMKGKEVAILRGHTWVFSGAVQKLIIDEKEPEEGQIVSLCDSAGTQLGWGHWHSTGSIVVRLLSRELQFPDTTYWINVVQSAVNKRKTLGLPNRETDAFRLIHGEGDQLPGLVVDVYGTNTVVQCHTTGMWLMRQVWAEVIENAMPEHSNSIVVLDERGRGKKEAPFFAKGHCESTIIIENGLKFHVDWITGQKTGFFIDQRDNRKLLQQFCKGKKVLNAFSYSGGFSVYALQSGASLVHSVDISKAAVHLAELNVSANFSDEMASKHKAICADVMSWLLEMPEKYDVVILDPPAFAKRRDARHKAIIGYKNLNYKALRQMKPGDILFTFSCSQVVDVHMFEGAVTSAAIEAGRTVSILHRLRQPADHPVNLSHHETDYLKGLVLYIDR